MKAAFIGYGYWGKKILKYFYNSEDSEIHTICDLNQTNLAQAKAEFPKIKDFSQDYKSAITNKEIEAVIIATPVSSHYDITKFALQNNKHVFVEKPITNSIFKIEELITLAQEKNLIIMVDHLLIYHPAVQKIRDYIANEEIGDIFYFDFARMNLGLFQKDVDVIWDLAPHDLAIMKYLFPHIPKMVSAFGFSHIKNQHNNLAYTHLFYNNNITAHFKFNWLAPTKMRKLIIAGSKKIIEYNESNSENHIVIYNRHVKSLEKGKVEYCDLGIEKPKIAEASILELVAKEFIHSVKTRQSPKSDAHFGLDIVRIIKALQESMEQGGVRVKV